MRKLVLDSLNPPVKKKWVYGEEVECRPGFVLGRWNKAEIQEGET